MVPNKKIIPFVVILTLGVVTPITYKVTTTITCKVEAENVAKSVSLTFPIKGEETSILKSSVQKYVNDMNTQAKAITNDQVLHDFYVRAPDTAQNYGVNYYGTNDTDIVKIDDYLDGNNVGISKGVALTFATKGIEAGSLATIKYSTDNTFATYEEVTTTKNYALVDNLYAGTTYYWNVTVDGVTSSTESFKTRDGFRYVTVPGITNVRDMGGRIVTTYNEDGSAKKMRIKQGLIFRGSEIVSEAYTYDSSKHDKNLTDENKRIMQEDLGIKYEIDFRGDGEANNITESPIKDSTHSDIKYLRVSNMAAYDWFFDITSSKEYYSKIKTMFQAFANAENEHIYFHCRGGADRTGTMGFVLGGLLGMSLTDLIIDFELTSFACNYRPHFANDISKVYRFPSLLAKVRLLKKSGTDETYWQEDKPISQILEEILIDKFNITKEEIAAIRANLLEEVK